ncbi:MAG TPA: hypothetical protein PK514_06020 [Spirochaetota bacterium]|nr:hypothetical protein [Spirochaetota bacterium]
MKERIIHSIFDVMGSNETALTRMLSSLLYKDITLLNQLLRYSFPGKNYKILKSEFLKTGFYFEKDNIDNGRTDIEIINDRFHIVIEAKIKNNTISFAQAEKYSEILQNSKSLNRLFIFLIEIDNAVIPMELAKKYPMINYSKLSWSDIYMLVHSRKEINVNLVPELLNSIKWSHDMKIHDIDIWAVVVRGKEIINMEKNGIYKNNKNHNPVFIAKREWDEELKKVIIKDLYPVISIHDPGSDIGKKYNTGKANDYIYELGKKMTLQEPIVKKFSQASAIAVSFSDI